MSRCAWTLASIHRPGSAEGRGRAGEPSKAGKWLAEQSPQGHDGSAAAVVAAELPETGHSMKIPGMLTPVGGPRGVCGRGRSGGSADLAEGVEEQLLPGPALGQMHGHAPGGAGASPRDGEQAEAQSTGGGASWQLLG